jgi:hypothetical protein
MFTTQRLLPAACWIVLLLLLPDTTTAELRQGDTLQSNDAVESIEFTILVGPGAELSEPVALDLGLGFPFWLHPIGQDDPQRIPIGAIPQESPGRASVAAGESATFVFRRDGEPGADPLRTSPQLLDGVQVSDIARVGVLSRGSQNWELSGYELKINQQLFAANDAVHRRAKESIEQHELSWVDLTGTLDPLRQEREDLRALGEAGLSEVHEISRFAELESQTEPLEKQLADCEAVLRGVSPWFVEQGVVVPGRSAGAPISDLKAIVVTAPHTNAQTYNRVYFRTGGRKYFLRPENGLLSPDAGPQQFNLELAAGPLTAGDVRGFSLGMLAHGQPYAQTPDRWHPQRLIVELDGRTTYDSQAETVDNLSLEVIRLIPPAHLDESGELTTNNATVLEVFVWHSGQAQGLDLVNGGALQTEDAAVVPAEPNDDPFPVDGDVGDQPPSGGQEIPGQGGECWPGESPLAGEPWPSPLPSEDPDQGDGGVDAWGPSDDFSPDLGDGAWDAWEAGEPWPEDAGSAGAGGIPVPHSDSDPGAWFLSLLGDLINQWLQWLGQEINNAVAIGEPPQINNVQLIRDENNPARLQVIWDVVNNNDSRITGFEIALWRLDPESGESFPIDSQTIDFPEIYASQWFDLSGLDDPAAYIKPWVSAVLDASDPSETTVADGAALPWLAADATPANQPQLSNYTIASNSVAANAPVVDLSEARIDEAAWKQRVASTLADVNLATYHIATNGVVGPPDADRGDVTLHYTVEEPLDPTRRYQVIGYIGFVSPSDQTSPATVEATCTLYRDGQRYSADPNDKAVLPSTVLQVGRNTAPQIFVQEIDFSAAPEGARSLGIDIKVESGAVDASAPLAVYALRLTAVE